MPIKVIFILVCLVPLCLFPQKLNDISLAHQYPRASLDQLIVPREAWHPYPTCSNPDGLENISSELQHAYIKDAENLLNYEWKAFPATVFLEFARIGNRSNYERLSFTRRQNVASLVLGELFERQGRFMDQIANGIWAICEESYWGIPAHNNGRGLPDVENPIIDLFAAETGALMAWTYYLLAPQLDEINPHITRRMLLETNERLLTPYLEKSDWGWMGFEWRNAEGYESPPNNWNPWINSNMLTTALLMEHNRDRRLDLIHKIMDSIDNFILPYPSDGGCGEGPSYWGRAGASLFDCLELLYSASNGEIDVYDFSLIKNIGTFIYKAYISAPYYINFADAPAKMSPDASLVYRYGKAIGDETMQQFGSFIAHNENLGEQTLGGSFAVLNRTLPALFSLNDLLATPPAEPLIRDVWLPDIQVLAARSQAASTDGFYLAAKGGHNDESHNHNDLGNFIVYYDGRPVFIDAGRQTYTAQTFSSRRYELWNNQSAFHNVPTINGVMQKEGRRFEAQDVHYKSSTSKVEFSLDIAGAYPADAQVEQYQRTITFNRGKNITIKDGFSLDQAMQPMEFNFLTPLQIISEDAGELLLTDVKAGKTFKLTYDKKLLPRVETITIDDTWMIRDWGDTLYRVVLTTPESELRATYTFKLDD